MSQSNADWSSQDSRAAAAIVSHHAQLSAALNRRTEALLALAETAHQETAHQPEAERARRELVEYLHSELVPHARAEEQALYPAAAAQPAGTLLIDGMLGEHRAIMALIEELESAPSTARAAASGRALAAVFAAHLAKENDLVVPLIAGAPDVSLADLLEGMHDLLGAAGGGETDGADTAEVAGGCGCGGCGCGGDAGTPDVAARALTIDLRLDVRDLPHGERHAAVLSALDAVAPGDALVLIAPHAPRPLLAEVETRYGGQFAVDWLQSGPEVWQLRLQRTPTRV